MFLGFWFVFQVMSGSISLVSGEMLSGVAYWAHIGGFAAGAGLILLLRKGPPPPLPKSSTVSPSQTYFDGSPQPRPCSCARRMNLMDMGWKPINLAATASMAT